MRRGCVYKPQRRRGRHPATSALIGLETEMQPLAAKLALSHRTPFSVEDILDPKKFTRRIFCAEDATTPGEKLFMALNLTPNCQVF